MKVKTLVSLLFGLAAVYDGVLGVAFLFAPRAIFDHCGITPPNHLGYVQFPAALLLVFALMYAVIAWDPVKNRGLIPYGALLKVSYCSVTFYWWLATGIPTIWKPFAVADLIFLALFAAAYGYLLLPRFVTREQ